MSAFELIRLVADTGLFILVWIVQLVIYPGFAYLDSSDLKIWHPIYTRRITLVVLPLMTAQITIGTIQLLQLADTYTALSVSLIIATWLLTFIQFVPLHGKLDNAEHPKLIVQSLVRKNWSRTVIWTVLFAMTVCQMMC